mmetsp:Transcript_7999/g.21365  ORF Transcript_7999/g.21365 Transcript_7999/m.21365 type:complete len:402 (-) Transcript_7999:105-1310(-)
MLAQRLCSALPRFAGDDSGRLAPIRNRDIESAGQPREKASPLQPPLTRCWQPLPSSLFRPWQAHHARHQQEETLETHDRLAPGRRGRGLAAAAALLRLCATLRPVMLLCVREARAGRVPIGVRVRHPVAVGSLQHTSFFQHLSLALHHPRRGGLELHLARRQGQRLEREIRPLRVRRRVPLRDGQRLGLGRGLQLQDHPLDLGVARAGLGVQLLQRLADVRDDPHAVERQPPPPPAELHHLVVAEAYPLPHDFLAEPGSGPRALQHPRQQPEQLPDREAVEALAVAIPYCRGHLPDRGAALNTEAGLHQQAHHRLQGNGLVPRQGAPPHRPQQHPPGGGGLSLSHLGNGCQEIVKAYALLALRRRRPPPPQLNRQRLALPPSVRLLPKGAPRSLWQLPDAW